MSVVLGALGALVENYVVITANKHPKLDYIPFENGKAITYYSNGKVHLVIEGHDGIKHGRETSYYKDGSVAYETDWYNNNRHGFDIIYHENGNIKSRYYYIHGKATGESTNYSEDGAIENILSWSDDKLHGRCVFIYPNGYDKAEINYYNGIKHGIERAWFPTGQIEYYVIWNMGKEEGPEKSWNEKGDLIRKTLWKNGYVISTCKPSSRKTLSPQEIRLKAIKAACLKDVKVK